VSALQASMPLTLWTEQCAEVHLYRCFGTGDRFGGVQRKEPKVKLQKLDSSQTKATAAA
jgi:hypothetical protein